MLERNFVKLEFILSFETLINSISYKRQAAASDNLIAKIAEYTFGSNSQSEEGSHVTLLVRFAFGSHEFVQTPDQKRRIFFRTKSSELDQKLYPHVLKLDSL